MVALFPAGVRNVLVVAGRLLDAHATATMLSALHSRESVRIHLLAVQPCPSGYAASFLDGYDLESAAHEQLAALRAELDALQTPYRTHISTGPWLDTIARYARELNCPEVIVGDNPNSVLNRLVLRHDRWRIASFLRSASHPQ
ncbi:MAG TPA: universal stress protein [Usitatibacter sp.]|nr:universal stress protein [Usitatibacter sp.]